MHLYKKCLNIRQDWCNKFINYFGRGLMRRWLTIAIAILFAFGGFVLLAGDNGLLHLYKVKQEKAKMETRIQQLQLQQADYREKINQLNSDPATIEKEIREQLKFVREDEKVFLLPKTAAGEP